MTNDPNSMATKTIPRSTNTVIIGGGIVGSMVAYFLKKFDPGRDILLLERSHIGLGSTGHSASAFRLQFTREFNVKLCQLSRKLYLTEVAEVFGQVPLISNGYLFLKETEKQLEESFWHVRNQRNWGVPVEVLSAQQIKERYPFIDTERVNGGTFCPDDGFIRSPAEIAKAAAERAEEMGVEIITKTSVLQLGTKDGEVRRILTDRGEIEVNTVINCAGAWSSIISGSANSYLPVKPVPRQLSFAKDVKDIPLETCPMIIAPNKAYCRPEGVSLMLGYAPDDTLPTFVPTYDYKLAVKTVTMLAEFIPTLLDAGLADHGDAGLYEVTHDHNALIGRDPWLRGLFHCTGFSGHGVMQGPGAALLLCELILHGETHSMDKAVFSGLSTERLKKGLTLPEDAVI
jgi:sarcosine oxidase subunit beta